MILTFTSEMERMLQFIFFTVLLLAVLRRGGAGTTVFRVGVVLNSATIVGKMGLTSISMAMDELYASHSNYTTRLVLHLRDSKNDVVLAASEGNLKFFKFSLNTLLVDIVFCD